MEPQANPFQVGDLIEAIRPDFVIDCGETFLVTGVTKRYVEFKDRDGDPRMKLHTNFKLINREGARFQSPTVEPAPALAPALAPSVKGWGTWA